MTPSEKQKKSADITPQFESNSLMRYRFTHYFKKLSMKAFIFLSKKLLRECLRLAIYPMVPLLGHFIW
jgi:hypothetical protein